MPADQETRIVEMRFDNRDFERNIKKSNKSLEDFKKELEFKETSKGLKDFASGINSINFQGLSGNIQKLADKFTGLGNAGEFVLSRIRSSLEGAALKLEGFIKSFTTAQIAVGQSKYDALNKSVQSLIATGKYTEDQAYSVFERVMQYTDQTSANFQTMVDQIASFVATGKGLTSSESAMEGISNMTMKAGKSATEASIAMGVFSKAMGQGFLSLQNWQSLNQSAHIITEDFRKQIISAAVSTGDLIKKQDRYYTNSKKYGKAVEVTAQNLENTLNKKWLSTDSMMAVFDKYYFEELDPDKAKNAMDILSKSVDKGGLSLEDFNAIGNESSSMAKGLRTRLIRAAVATGDLTEKNGKYYTNAKKYGKEIEVTAQNLEQTLNAGWASKDTVGSVLNDYKFAETAYKSAQRALTFADAMNAIKESISSGWMESFRLIFGDVTEAMELFTNLCERVIESLEGLKEARNSMLRVWAANGGRSALIETILGDYGKDVETGAYGLLDLFDDVGSIISKGFWDMVKIFASGSDKVLWDEDGYKEAWFGLKLRDITNNIRDFIASIKTFFTEDVKVGDKTKTRLEMISDIVSGIGATTALAWEVVAGIIHFVVGLRQQLQPTIDAITNFFSQLGIVLYKTAEQTHSNKSITGFFDQLLGVTKPLTSSINRLTTSLTGMLLTFIKWGIESGAFAKAFQFLQNAFKKIGGVINRVAIPIITFLTELSGIFTDLFSSGFDPKKMNEIGSKIKAALDKMLSSILGVESLDKAGEQLKVSFNAMIDGVMDSMPDGVKKAIYAIKDLFGLWKDESEGDQNSIFTRIRKFFEGGFGKVFGFLKNLFASFKEFNLATALKTGFGFGAAYNFISEIAGWFKGTNLYGVIMAFLGVATLVSLFKLINNIKNIGRNLKEATGEIAESLKSGFKVRFDDYGDYLLKMAQGIAIFVAIVAVLGSLDTKSLLQGVIALGIVMGMVILFNKLLKKDFDKGSLGDQVGFASQLIAIGAAISSIMLAMSVLMLAILPLSKDGNKMITAIAGFTAMMLVISIFIKSMIGTLTKAAKTMNKDGKAGVKEYLGLSVLMVSLGTAIAVMSVGISMLLLAMVPLANTSWEGLMRAAAGFIVILAAIGIFIHLMIKDLLKWSVILGDAKKTSVTKVGAMLLMFSASVVLLSTGLSMLMLAILPMANMSSEGFTRAMLGLTIVMTELALLIKFVQKTNKGTTGATVKIAGLAAFAAGIGILILALLPLAALKWEAWFKAIVGLGLVMLELGIFIKIIQNMSAGDKTLSVKIAGLAAFAAGIGVLILAMMPMAFLKWEALLRAIGGLGLVMLELIVFIKIIQMMSSNDKTLSVKIAGLTGLAIGIGILVLSLIPLSTMPVEDMVKAIAGMTAIMLVLAIFCKAVEGITIKVTKMLGVLVVAGAVALIANTISPIANMNWEQFARAMLGMLTIVGLLAAFMLVASKMSVGIGSLLAMLGLILVVVSISFALNEIKNINTDVMLTFMGGLAAVVLSMAGVIVILSAVPLTAGLKAIVLLGLAITTIVAVLSAVIPMLIGAVGSSMTDFSAKLLLISSIIQEFSSKINATDESGISKAENIFDRLKNMISKLTGFGNFAAAINNFTVALFDLGTGLEIYYNHTKDLPDPADSNAFKMVDALVPMAASLSGFSVGDFATEIFKLVNGLYAFDYIGTEMSDAHRSKPLLLLQDLAGCAQDLRILSGLGLDQLKSQLAGLGGAMMLYAEGAQEITGVEGDQIGNVQGAIGILRAITESFAAEGGFTLPTIPSENELGSFGADLAALAGAICKFVDASSGLGEGTDKAIELLDFIGGDLKQKLTADNLAAANAFKDAGVKPYDLATFAVDIIGLGNAIMMFADSTKDVEEGKLKNALRALDFFAELRGKLVAEDSVLSVINFFTGNSITTNQLTQFGKDIEALGLALKSFATSVEWGEDQQGSFENALEALGFLSDLNTKLAKIETGGLVDVIKGKNMTLTDLASQIEALGLALSDFNGKLVNEDGSSKVNIDTMNSAISVLWSIGDFLEDLSNEMPRVGGLLDIFTGKAYNASNLADDVAGLEDACGKLKRLSDILVGSDGQTQIINTSQLGPAIEVLDQISDFVLDLSEKMPEVGGLLPGLEDAIFGEEYGAKDLAGDIKAFSDCCVELQNISAALTGEGAVIDPNQLTPAISTMDSILTFVTDLQEKMPQIGGLINGLDGAIFGTSYDLKSLKSDLGDFKGACEELSALGEALSGKNGEQKLIDDVVLSSSLATIDNILSFITGLQERMPKIGGLQATFETFLSGGKYSTDHLKTDMGNIGEAIGAFSTGIGSGFNAESVNAAIGVVEVFAEIMSTLAGIGDGSYFDVSLYIDGLNELLLSMNGTDGNDHFKAVEGAVDSVVYLMHMISEAVEKYGGISADDINSFTQMALALKHLTEIDPSFDFVVVGESIANGVATGIKNTTSSVTIAARNMAIAAYNAAMNELQAASPSKLFKQVGGFITSGMSIGIDNGTKNVEKSAVNMSEASFDSAMSVIGLISQTLSDDLDANPTITPVLDLTNVTEGVGILNGMFGGRYMSINAGNAASIAANSVPASGRMDINQNSADYSGIYERMNALGEAVAGLGETISKMKIVLDSGVIAGAVTDTVDENIGRSMFYAERGN